MRKESAYHQVISNGSEREGALTSLTVSIFVRPSLSSRLEDNMLQESDDSTQPSALTLFGQVDQLLKNFFILGLKELEAEKHPIAEDFIGVRRTRVNC